MQDEVIKLKKVIQNIMDTHNTKTTLTDAMKIVSDVNEFKEVLNSYFFYDSTQVLMMLKEKNKCKSVKEFIKNIDNREWHYEYDDGKFCDHDIDSNKDEYDLGWSDLIDAICEYVRIKFKKEFKFEMGHVSLATDYVVIA